jgi:hypothetical protein
MSVDRYLVCVISLVMPTFAARWAMAGDGHCAHCGASGRCRKVCRLVVEDKSVSITCWGCICEDLCLPGPSKPGCEHCKMLCHTCEACRDGSPVRAEPKRFVWTNWIPGSAKVHTKTKLMKKTVTQKVPVHRWIVEDLCSQCWQDTQDRHAAENETMLRMPEPNLDRNQAQLGPGIP